MYIWDLSVMNVEQRDHPDLRSFENVLNKLEVEGIIMMALGWRWLVGSTDARCVVGTCCRPPQLQRLNTVLGDAQDIPPDLSGRLAANDLMIEEAGADVCVCHAPTGIVVDSPIDSITSPLWCLSCRLPVPIWGLKLPGNVLCDLHAWRRASHACQALANQSTIENELACREEIVSPKSGLAAMGLTIRSAISERLLTPTYYALIRESEESGCASTCPCCGGGLKVHELSKGLLCDRCMLLIRFG